ASSTLVSVGRPSTRTGVLTRGSSRAPRLPIRDSDSGVHRSACSPLTVAGPCRPRPNRDRRGSPASLHPELTQTASRLDSPPSVRPDALHVRAVRRRALLDRHLAAEHGGERGLLQHFLRCPEPH